MLLVLMLALGAVDPSAAPADARAATLRAQARAALGGEPALAAVQALSLQGRFRRTPPPSGAAQGQAPRPSRGRLGREAEGDLAVEIALPDKMRREESFAVGSGPSFTMVMGLDGENAWMGTEGAAFGGRGFGARGGPDGPEGASPEDRQTREAERRAAMGRRMQAELSRMLLALLAEPGPGASVYGGQAESPDGRADVLDVTAASGAKTRLFLDATTHLPLMVTYQETLPARRFRRPPAAAEGSDRRPPTPEPDASPSDAAPRTVESTLFLSDHRAVGGVALPHHLSRAINGSVVEEWEVARWRVNPGLKPERFAKQ